MREERLVTWRIVNAEMVEKRWEGVAVGQLGLSHKVDILALVAPSLGPRQSKDVNGDPVADLRER